jgi:hypothetical protein
LYVQTPCLQKKKEKITEEVNLSFASMVKGHPFTTFSKKTIEPIFAF